MFEYEQAVELTRDNPVAIREQPIIKGDGSVLLWRVRVSRGGKPFDLAGVTATLYCARAVNPDTGEGGGTTFSDAACLAGGVIEAELPQDAANIPGAVGCTMCIVLDGRRVSVARMAVEAIDPIGSDIVDVGKRIPSIDEVLAALDRCESAAQAANTATGKANTAAIAANTAATNANAAAQTANAAAARLDGMTATAMGLDAGSTPTVDVATGEDGARVLSFGIPKGDKGDTGPQGPKGDTGDIGNLTINGKTPDGSGAVTLTPGDLRAATAEEVSQLKGEMANSRVSIKLSGITGNIQSVIDSGEYNELIIDRDVSIESVINVPSNFSIIGAGGVITSTLPTIFKCVGTISSDAKRSAGTEYKEGDNTFDVTGFEIGDDVFVKGTYNLLGANCDEKYRLGVGTGGTGYEQAYIGMITKISGVTDNAVSTQAKLPWFAGGVTIAKIETAKNIVFRDLIIKSNVGDIENKKAWQGRIHVNNGENITVENCRIEIDYGTAIFCRTAKGLNVDNCFISGSQDDFTDHAERNLVRLRGAMYSAVTNCTIENGTQSIDISYYAAENISHNVHVANNNIHAFYTGATTHPGTLRVVFDGNIIKTEGDGISVRGQHQTVQDCIIKGAGTSSDYGVGFVEGSSTHCAAHNNQIDNFDFPFFIHESGADDRATFFHSSMQMTISGNKCALCRSPLRIRRDAAGLKDVSLNLVFSDNVVALWENAATSQLVYCDNVEDSTIITRNIIVKGNVFTNDGANSIALLRAGCVVEGLVFVDNIFNIPTFLNGCFAKHYLLCKTYVRNNIYNCSALNETSTKLEANSFFAGNKLPVVAERGDIFSLDNVPYIFNGSWVTLASAMQQKGNASYVLFQIPEVVIPAGNGCIDVPFLSGQSTFLSTQMAAGKRALVCFCATFANDSVIVQISTPVVAKDAAKFKVKYYNPSGASITTELRALLAIADEYTAINS